MNRGNVTTLINAWTVSISKYGAGALDWTKEELKSIDIKTRKLMTMNERLHPRGNVGRLYLARKQGGRGAYKLWRTWECGSAELGQVS